MILKDKPLVDLIGLWLKREDVILRVRSVSITENRTVYIHPGNPDSFGWTFKTADGNVAGAWEEV